MGIEWKGNLTCNNPSRQAVIYPLGWYYRGEKHFPNTLVGWVLRIQHFFYGEINGSRT